MTKRPMHRPNARQTQDTAVELVDSTTYMGFIKPRSCPYADTVAAASQTHSPAHTRSHLHTNSSRGKRDDRVQFAGNAAAAAAVEDEDKRFRAYHYTNGAYPDHSFQVEYSDDPRYPAGEYPDGAYPTDTYLVGGVDSGSELVDGDEYEDEDEDEGYDKDEDEDEGYYDMDLDLDPRVEELHDGDKNSAHGDCDCDWDGNADESVDREDPVPDTRAREPIKAEAGGEIKDMEPETRKLQLRLLQ
ncbi:uncharacterized protein Z520_01011 [Fonsecaea multimorphosa CBS 102226]|uniref:Uncharacterized protein n=1 Tax=Fonsecaea multimorphosa CBS 102226 TaxID=1442371 RepID=A0A0D2HKX4_9EURO|nr:uncharacterized protein Z520_01011 [Fonsecaea multimorphosa CBS 102226]KIY02546.1 hypothetical protein Z520_01011 [Fonsecaea multimorphosa CBS 102226]OAL31413.1 hypothetical protein AYO22_01005 [Fonsecaea multimorphosa]